MGAPVDELVEMRLFILGGAAAGKKEKDDERSDAADGDDAGPGLSWRKPCCGLIIEREPDGICLEVPLSIAQLPSCRTPPHKSLTFSTQIS